MSDIKPCPFCGPSTRVSCDLTEDDFYFQVGCGACGARSGIVLASKPGARDAVISAWNRRTPCGETVQMCTRPNRHHVPCNGFPRIDCNRKVA